MIIIKNNKGTGEEYLVKNVTTHSKRTAADYLKNTSIMFDMLPTTFFPSLFNLKNFVPIIHLVVFKKMHIYVKYN